jgi:predicted dinucleotide-binding enzyme
LKKYQALRFFTKYGTAIAVLVGVALPAIALLAMLENAAGGLVVLLSIPAGCFAGFVMKVFSDLAQVIVDMLLPSADYDTSM